MRPLRRSCDVLIGADGVHSLVRRSGCGAAARARTHGRTVLRGTAPIAPPDVSETWGGGWLFSITPMRDGTTNWFACIPEHRSASTADALAHLQHVVGGNREEIDRVLAAARPEETLVHGIATAPLVWPVRDSAVLVGDAAHAMAPNLGHGANTALIDAATLARCLRGASSADVRRRLAGYAVRRHVPDQAWRIGSDLMLRAGTMPPPRASARDRVLRTAQRLLPSP